MAGENVPDRQDSKMPEQSSQLQDGPEKQKPAIRTMKSDVQELFRTNKPSLLQIIGQEIKDAPVISKEKPRSSYLLVAAGVIFFIVAVGSGYFLYSYFRGDETAQKLTPPAAFFVTESSRTIAASPSEPGRFLSLMRDSSRELEREGTIQRILIRLQGGPTERFATLADFFDFYQMNPPKNFLDRITAPLMIFFYQTGTDTSFGLATKTVDPDRTFRDMLLWETSILTDIRPLFFDKTPEVVIAPFEDRVYRNIDWRYQKLSQAEDLGIGYAVFPAKNLLLITTGKEAMETTINRLFDAR